VYTEQDSSGLEEVEAMGFGCICVHREVFEAMPPPWFHIPWNEQTMKYDCGEDVYFCRKAKENGFQVMLDHDLTKEVAHIGSMEFGNSESLSARSFVEGLRAQVAE
jgi:hypothetical protein